MKLCGIKGCNGKFHARNMCATHYRRWQKTGDAGSAELLRSENGKGSINLDGYKIIADKYEHRSLAEKALGRPLKHPEEVHHFDHKNKSNDSLVICPNHRYHMLLHRRQRSLEATGNPDFEKCRYCGGYDNPLNMTKKKTLYSDFYHASCYNDYQKLRYHSRRNSAA